MGLKAIQQVGCMGLGGRLDAEGPEEGGIQADFLAPAWGSCRRCREPREDTQPQPLPQPHAVQASAFGPGRVRSVRCGVGPRPRLPNVR